jgi:hypothetical protein
VLGQHTHTYLLEEGQRGLLPRQQPLLPLLYCHLREAPEVGEAAAEGVAPHQQYCGQTVRQQAHKSGDGKAVGEGEGSSMHTFTACQEDFALVMNPAREVPL